MNQEKIKINKTTCERLCREVCRNFVPISSRSAHKEALLFGMCQEIFNYLNEDFILVPLQNASHLETYKSNIQLIVSARREEYFNVLEIVERYIDETLNKSYQSRFQTSCGY